MKKPKLPVHTMSSGNIFADLGLPNAEELLLKAQIVSEINDGDQAAVAEKISRSEAVRRPIEQGLRFKKS